MNARIAGSLFALCLAGCNPAPRRADRSTPQPVPSASATATVLPIRILAKHKIRIGWQQGNRKLLELQANSMESTSTQSSALTHFLTAHVIFYDRDGSTLAANAPATTVNERTREVVMTGGVHATTSTGITLTCDQLTYDGKSGMIHGAGNVHITKTENGARSSAYGSSFDSNLKFTKMVMR